jgi:hypothetical protein
MGNGVKQEDVDLLCDAGIVVVDWMLFRAPDTMRKQLVKRKLDLALVEFNVAGQSQWWRCYGCPRGKRFCDMTFWRPGTVTYARWFSKTPVG